MISLILRRRRRQVRALAELVDAERQLLRDMRFVGHKRLQQTFSHDSVLFACFVGGFVTGRHGKKLLRPLRAIPVISIIKRLRPYLPFGF